MEDDDGTGADSQENILQSTVPGLASYAVPINQALTIARQLKH